MSKSELTLIQKQKIFSKKMAELILSAYSLGYEITMGECFRTLEQADIYASTGKGVRNSQHCLRLAVDLNLFKNGLLVTDSFGHTELGTIWKSWSTEDYKMIWGGDFWPNPDGNHYEMR